MYLKNKYTKWYYNIINNATQNSEYIEKHHIIPRSLGGENSRYNIVQLTAREHFICYLLLIKMTKSSNRTKMVYALWMMNKGNKKQHRERKINSTTYSIIRKEYSKVVSKRRTGTKMSAETKAKISAANKGKTHGRIYKTGKSEAWYIAHAKTHKGKSNKEKSKIKSESAI